MARIFIVHSEREKFEGKVIPWKEYELHFSPFSYEDFIEHRGHGGILLNESVVDVVAGQAEDFDAVWCESPEALILQTFRDKKGLRRIPFVIHEQDRLRRVKVISEWLRQNMGAGPLDEFLEREENVWFHMTGSHRDFYLDAGIPGGKLYHTSLSSYLLNFVAPEILQTLRETHGRKSTGDSSRLSGKIIAGGSNIRDYSTLGAATRGLGEDVHIICDLSHFMASGPDNVHWHDFVPLRDYMDILKHARFVVVPLVNESISGGENTITFSMALSKAVVATRIESTEDFLTHEHDCLLVPPGDSAALREAMRRLLDDPALAEQLGENARVTEERLSQTCEKNYTQAFQKALSMDL